MTREEAVTVLKAFMENPLFSDEHKVAFNIAIHDIKQRHDWDINKLMLVPKTEWEQEPILDKIRAEIEQYQSDYDVHGTEYDRTAWTAFNRCLQIIDKYKAESEETETWNGIHAQITAPKGTFERIFNNADDDTDI